MKVYVKNKQRKWLMPTHAGKARWLLKQGKAKVIRRTPFCIQLSYDTTDYLQDITVGIDDGGIQVGIAVLSNKEAIYQEKITLRTDIRGKVDTRRSYRRSGRNRKTRYRKARWMNRKKNQVIPPSIKAKKDSIARTILRLPLPVPALIRLEDCFFDTQAMENHDITGKQYQEGAMLYEKNYRGAAKKREGYKCRVCHSEEQLQIHHITYRSQGGSDKLSNLMTLCSDCHEKHHKAGLKLPKQKSASYLSAAHVQQGKYYLQDLLKGIAPLQTTFGYITSHHRRKADLEKSHVHDAVIIADKTAKPLDYYFKTLCVESGKRSLHEATARKGRKQPNKEQKRNAKNTFKLKGFCRYDAVTAFGQQGFITGFTGTSGCYIKNISGSYIKQPEKSYSNVSLSKTNRLYGNQGRITTLMQA